MNNSASGKIELSELEINNETFFRISNVDKMRTFFMSIVSDSNHWLFIGSNGGLSAGRKNSDFALFPYYTDDKIVESSEVTGSKSIFLVEKNGVRNIWEPYSIRFSNNYKIERNLFKNIYGNKVIFEEINYDLGLTYQYEWNSSNQYGFVRKSRIKNNNEESLKISLLDGIQNIVPYGVGSDMQNQYSTLVDAYKRNELDIKSGIGIYALSAIIVDKAEPSEALKANIAWSYGLENPTYLLSSLQLEDFRKGKKPVPEEDVKAEKGAYFLSKELKLSPGENKQWAIVANVNQDMASVVNLSKAIQEDPKISEKVSADIEAGTKKLIELNAAADGLQLSSDSLKDTRHFANSLFNIMRGGIFDKNYQIEKNDFLKYLAKANINVIESCKVKIEKLADEFSLNELLEVANDIDDKAFNRLALEYLPLKFSRRHGDPSRPWNKFSINTQDENDGSKILDYQGNWRDIFQNWEALAHSYPEFIEGMIFRFLNASTFDGYNPYRITKNGIDWERIEPDDPWSYIGYWGDHQIIYLLKFLEFSEKYYPGKLHSYFTKDLFVYANVPYRIKPYKQLLDNPKDTIDFDHDVDREIMKKWPTLGADSALLVDQNNNVVQINFVEKLLASYLAKISNLIPEGGIWMNTQRPEWNDANNALVGNGVSMVTLYYMIRFAKFAQKLLQDSTSVTISEELYTFFKEIFNALEDKKNLLSGKIDDKDRKSIMDALGTAASNYRENVYKKSFKGVKTLVSIDEIRQFFELSQHYLDHSLRSNKRTDGLYHAYNLMTVENEEEVSVSYLSEMLEGQVAVLSSGQLSSKQALEVLDALKESKLFREDQYTYLLYPEKRLPGFMERNNIPEASVKNSKLLNELVEAGNTQIIVKDENGGYHFNGNFKNAGDLDKALGKLDGGRFGGKVKQDREQVLKTFEEVFNHKSFTGRSGTFYGYEGLGSIYWHMVSKLLLAVQECAQKAIKESDSKEVIGRLLEHYYEIQAGIGNHKSPELYGAFPTDPYSHTPKTKGAQQPGMTGQVKEDVISRFGELGVEVKDGKLGFNPRILRKDEFLKEPATFEYYDINSEEKQIKLSAESLSFTFCQIPVVYNISETNRTVVEMNDLTKKVFEGLEIDQNISARIFGRTGEVQKISIDLDRNILK